MKIQDPNVSGPNGIGSDKTRPASRVEREGQAGAAGAGKDRVELSTLADRVWRALGVFSADHAARVERISQDYRAGTYVVDAAAVSRALVADALLFGA
jgi:anti-sigma28 factor (negative regulator of flagellin synthesis)